MKKYLISLLLIMAYASNVLAASNVIYDFEDDRDLKKQKNITYVQPESEYTQKKISVIELRCKAIEDELKKLNDEVRKLRDLVQDMESRLVQAQKSI